MNSTLIKENFIPLSELRKSYFVIPFYDGEKIGYICNSKKDAEELQKELNYQVFKGIPRLESYEVVGYSILPWGWKYLFHKHSYTMKKLEPV